MTDAVCADHLTRVYRSTENGNLIYGRFNDREGPRPKVLKKRRLEPCDQTRGTDKLSVG